MKKFLVILTICISVFSITAFAAPDITFDDKIVKDVGNSWILTHDNNGYSFLCKVKDGDIKKVTSDGIYFNGDVVIYSRVSSKWEKITSNQITGVCSSDNTIYLSGINKSHFDNIEATVSQEKVGNLNFHLPSLVEQQAPNLATMIKGSSLTCSRILKVALLGLAILLVVPLVVRVIRSYL